MIKTDYCFRMHWLFKVHFAFAKAKKDRLSVSCIFNHLHRREC
ncbi:hypothetical protein [Dokdonia sp.]